MSYRQFSLLRLFKTQRYNQISFKFFICQIIVFITAFVVGRTLCAIYESVSKPTISVVMSTYNRAEFLPRAVISILNQTYDDFEFIIIDDGSSDLTPWILDYFSEKDKRIRLITNNTNRGLVYSLNLGLNAARGKYIARMDDDDISLPDRFAYQVLFMENNPHITVSGSLKKTVFANQEIKPEFLSPYQPTEQDISDSAIISYFQVPIFHPTAMIRKDFLDTFNIRYNEQYINAEDTPFWHDIVLNGGKIVQLPAILVYRGISPKDPLYIPMQINSYNQFLNYALADILPPNLIKGWVSSQQVCMILQLMKSHIGKKPYFNNNAINHVMDLYRCMPTKN